MSFAADGKVRPMIKPPSLRLSEPVLGEERLDADELRELAEMGLALKRKNRPLS